MARRAIRAAIASERTGALQQRVEIQIATIDGFKAELEEADQAMQAVQGAIKALRARARCRAAGEGPPAPRSGRVARRMA